MGRRSTVQQSQIDKLFANPQLTIRQMSELIGVSYSTAFGMIRRHKIPHEVNGYVTSSGLRKEPEMEGEFFNVDKYAKNVATY